MMGFDLMLLLGGEDVSGGTGSSEPSLFALLTLAFDAPRCRPLAKLAFKSAIGCGALLEHSDSEFERKLCAGLSVVSPDVFELGYERGS